MQSGSSVCSAATLKLHTPSAPHSPASRAASIARHTSPSVPSSIARSGQCSSSRSHRCTHSLRRLAATAARTSAAAVLARSAAPLALRGTLQMRYCRSRCSAAPTAASFLYVGAVSTAGKPARSIAPRAAPLSSIVPA